RRSRACSRPRAPSRRPPRRGIRFRSPRCRTGPPASSRVRRMAFSYFDGDDVEKARGLFQLIKEDGTPVDEAALADLDRDLARTLFEAMVRIRVTDARMMA